MTELRQTDQVLPAAQRALNRQDITWALGLFGTAIGAGTLFLPIAAGIGGTWTLLFIALFALPVTYFSHRALTRFVQSGADSDRDITDVVGRHFGPHARALFTVLYFFAIFPILLVYSVAITNTTLDVLTHQLGMTSPPRALVSFLLIAVLIGIARGGERRVVKAMSYLVYPFIAALVILSLILIPHWSTAFFAASARTEAASSSSAVWTSIWMAIPVLVFSFNHSPIISAFAMDQRQRYGANADRKSCQILGGAHLLMVATVLLFVFSCVLSLTPADLAEAKADNITILSYLARHFNTRIIEVAAPIIALIAIAKSFLGHYIGAREGAVGLIEHVCRGKSSLRRHRVLNDVAAVLMGLSCWGVATLNPGILSMIEKLGGPIIALLLFLLPMVAIYTLPVLSRYRRNPSNLLVIVIGVLAVLAAFSQITGILSALWSFLTHAV